MKKKGSLILVAITLCLSILYGINEPGHAEKPPLPDNLIRFHVIANSDTEEDQRLKRDVRDAILEEFSDDFSKAKDIEQARKLVLGNLKKIEQVASEEIKAQGEDYPVKAHYGDFDFPAKAYGTFTLPAGNYKAVRVVIGEGSGENWWCVLFPPLCFVDISNSSAVTPEVTKAYTGIDQDIVHPSSPSDSRVQVKLKLMEVIKKTEESVAAEVKKQREDET